MKLKAIDIQGFKSFADKIKLDFDHGITAVVGPNGSGKSNIADAVRWVLGEQSVKTLRGGKMEDVIFNGTQSRKAQGVASVTLVIDNSDKTLPLEADEVAVSRKLYRSGESEYRINENPVRLKDVNELFMDTGIGRDGYAIIGQGKVSEIVSARSKERREIFEEAAGISKFRYRKGEAEKQLQLSEENLSRLRDILSEIEGRVEPLRLQSEKAQRFIALAEEKKSLEISLSIHNLSVLNKQNAVTEDKLLLAKNDYENGLKLSQENEEKYNLHQEKGKLLNIEIDDLRHSLNAVTEEIAEISSKTAVIKNDISHYQSSIGELQTNIDKASFSKSELLIALEALNKQKIQKQAEIENLKSQYFEMKKDGSQILTQQEELNREIERIKLKRAGVYDALEQAKVNTASSKSIISESSLRLNQIDSSKEEIITQLGDIEREINDCDKLFTEIENNLVSVENSISGYSLKKTSREKKLNEISQRVKTVQNDISAKKQKATLLTDLENSMEGFGQSVKLVINQQRHNQLLGILGTVSSLLSTEDKYSVAIETALGAGMQNIVTETTENAKSAIYMLKNQRAGRATFLPLDTIKAYDTDMSSLELLEGFVGKGTDLIKFDEKYKNIFNWLLGRIIIANDLNCATNIAKKANYKYKVVTLDGQVVNAGGSLTGGFTAKSSGILSRKSEIDRLNNESEKLAQSIKADESLLSETENEINAINAELNASEALKKTLNEDKLRAEMQKKALVSKLAEKKKNKADIESEATLITKRISEIKEKSQQSDKLFEDLNNELLKMQEALNKFDEKKNSLASLKEEFLVKQNEQNARILVLESNLETAEREIQNQNLVINSNEQEKADTLLKIENLKNLIDNAQSEIEALNEKEKNSKSLTDSFTLQTNEKISERLKNEQLIVALREEEKELSSRRDELYKEVVRLSQQQENFKTEINSIISSLYDQYELTLSAAEEMSLPLADINSSNRHLSELKNKIRNLGNVNVGAIEEYEEVKTRFDELSSQINDVTKAKEELNKLINELTGQMCTIFTDKFQKIGENFSVTFKELFGGGQGKLTLSDPDDILESGIEISVTPPGKVIKNLASLSGGEQSFVAIAIFFAILKVNPSPFCLMDEIEAALDDVNVSKFASYLHGLTDKTQFITITHRRGTMEEANVLYGVTMQEEGVSKLLKLDADNVEKDFYK